MSVALDQFHRFHIKDKFIEDAKLCYGGEFEPTPKTYDSWVGYIFTIDGRYCHGQFNRRGSLNQFTFHPRNFKKMELEVGDSYYYLDSYWGERAALVLDRDHKWMRKEFQAQDAFEPEWSPRGGAHYWGKAHENATAPGRVIPGGWNHQHCAICWSKISQSEQMHGYRSEEDIWVCEACYNRYIKPGSLDFIANA